MIWRKVTEFPQYSVSESGLVRNDITGLVLKTGMKCKGYNWQWGD